MAKQTLDQMFQNPGSEFRGKPFWAWNGALEEEELRRQIRVMREMGLGGAFLHSRVGLATPYLSEEWMRLIRACIDESQKLGMEAWLYDEDRWPSGAAGGIVTKNPKYRQRYLVCDRVAAEKFRWSKDCLAAWTAGDEGNDCIANPVRLRAGERPPKGTTVFHCRVEVAECTSWHNGYTYLDTISHEAVAEFIRVTHEAYRRSMSETFGKTVPGIFTDEPNYGRTLIPHKDFSGNKPIPPQVPWTGRLLKIFKDRYGYNLRDHLLEIFFDVDGRTVSRAKHDYFDCITFLFTDAFARQIGEWCERNNLLFTGHVLQEQTPESQTESVGAAMRFYEHMQAPGIDILTQFWYEYDTAKQCSSVLRQTGRKWMLSELYGCTGWDFSFEGHKAIGDWQAALGVNLRCQHLSWYTMAGEAKRDYPASISYQSPWWRQYRQVEDYFARVGVAMTQGEPVRDILMIHPIESMWVRFMQGNRSEREVLNQQMQAVRNVLLENHLDFDYGDEEMLSRLGSVSRKGDDARLRVGKALYRAVVVPPMLTMRRSTLELLQRFARSGGLVLFAGDAAEHIDALPSRDAVDFAASLPKARIPLTRLPQALAKVRTISIANAAGREIAPALYMLRADKAGDLYLFICNTNRKRGFEEVRVSLDGKGHVEEWDAATGERFQADAFVEQGNIRISTSLPPSGSRLFVIRGNRDRMLSRRPDYVTVRQQKCVPTRWKIQYSEDNVLLLDQPEWRLGNSPWRERKEILKIDLEARTELGWPWRSADMVQPWAREPRKTLPRSPLTLRHRFQARALPAGPLYLAIEQPEAWRVTLNGHRIATDTADAGWWTDRAIRRIPIDPAALQLDENIIELATDFGEDIDLEACFLLGDFGVTLHMGNKILDHRRGFLRPGNWVTQGLPFYSGSVVYRRTFLTRLQKGERLVLVLPKWAGTCVRVLANNGQEAGILGWPPYEIDLTDFCREGQIDLCIEVFGSRYNSFGPLHHTSNQLTWVGSGEFQSQGEKWQDDYNLKPGGLLEHPRLEIRRERAGTE